MVVITANWNTKANPLLTIIRQESAVMIRCAAELGFTPVARMRVKGDGDGDKEKNPFDEFAQGAGSGSKPN
jgi:P27 family predicted phage terminase small subunit